jgi:hypothetical protein
MKTVFEIIEKTDKKLQNNENLQETNFQQNPI